MAKARRANHRGAEKPRWTPDGDGTTDGTVDGSTDGGADGSVDSVVGGRVDGRQPARPGQNTGGNPGRQSAANGQHALNAPPGQPGVTGPGSNFGAPVQVDQIAVAAMALSEGLAGATRGLPESVEARRHRRDLDEAATVFRTIAADLETTAGALVRLAANDGQSCAVSWGICPEHGISLMEVGEVATCRVLSCHRQPVEAAQPCALPVAYRVVDVAGPAVLTCSGHAIACRLQWDHAVITLASDSMELL